MTDAPERIWMDWKPGMAVTSGPLAAPPRQEYVRADLVPKWQPIENAPMDGTQILGAWQCLNKTWDMNAMFYFEEDGEGGWFDYHAEYMHNPTHWMPLPPTPEVSA
jgi:hypothetical protein